MDLETVCIWPPWQLALLAQAALLASSAVAVMSGMTFFFALRRAQPPRPIPPQRLALAVTCFSLLSALASLWWFTDHLRNLAEVLGHATGRWQLAPYALPSLLALTAHTLLWASA